MSQMQILISAEVHIGFQGEHHENMMQYMFRGEHHANMMLCMFEGEHHNHTMMQQASGRARSLVLLL